MDGRKVFSSTMLAVHTGAKCVFNPDSFYKSFLPCVGAEIGNKVLQLKKHPIRGASLILYQVIQSLYFTVNDYIFLNHIKEPTL